MPYCANLVGELYSHLPGEFTLSLAPSGCHLLDMPRRAFSDLISPAVRCWKTLSGNVRGAILVSLGALLLTMMATLVKFLGSRLDSFQILFFRSFIGLLFILPLAFRHGWNICRTGRPMMHVTRGGVGILGNFCFFYAITHLLLADAMALQFSRPLFMIVLAALFLNEIVGWKRGITTLIGFSGILMMTRPFGESFQPEALVGALGALLGGLVVVAIKQLSRTESTLVIMFYYSFWGAVFSFIPAWIVWTDPTWSEIALLTLVGFFGIAGQSWITHGVAIAETTVIMPFDYLRIVFAALFGILLFDEWPGGWSLAGAGVIVATTLFLLRQEAQRKSPES
jgi:drug/metabolite transporter (DMT)-like permease